MLEVSGLNAEYAAKGKPVRAAIDIGFTVERGKFFTLLGPSGCGKTTTLRSIAGLEKTQDRRDHRQWADHVLGGDENLRGPEQAQFRHGVPILRHLAAYERVRERGLSLAGAGPGAERHRTPRRRCARRGGACRCGGAQRHRGSPAGSSSGSALGARHRDGAPSWFLFCSTSLCPISMPNCASACVLS